MTGKVCETNTAPMIIEKQANFTYDDLIQGLKENKFKNICFATGAGISVSSGIPDFRSPKTGLYENLKEYNLPKPESIFDINCLNEKPDAFNKLAKDFLNDDIKPSKAHYFPKLI